MSDTPFDENFTPQFALESGGNLAAAKVDLDTLVTNAVSLKATGDGVLQTLVPVTGRDLYSSGGPVNSSGVPQQLTYDRGRSLQGKLLTSATITTTVAGDTALACSAGAMKTVMPGQSVDLAIGSASAVETVYVATSYTPVNNATSIPLQAPVVNASSTQARWDIFSPTGSGFGATTAHGLQPIVLMMQDGGTAGKFYPAGTTGGDGQGTTRYMGVTPQLYNGLTADRQRGNLDNISLVASAAYTTTQTTGDQTNYNGRGVIVVLDMTNVGAGPSVTLEIDGKDPVSGKYYSLLTGAAVTTVSTNVYTVYPGGPATANVSANAPLPRTWRVKVTANNANSGTYSVGASVIL